jgi:predicted alpha/beta hydrolase
VRKMNFQRSPLSTWAGLKRTNHFLEAKFHKIHVLQIISSNTSQSSAPAVLLVHGAISNGNIFYSNKSGLGLGPYLARHGFNVFCVDLRGKGLSLPKLSEERVAHGLTEIICDTIPLVSEFVCEQSQQEKQSWISHSYGGVLLTSSMVRFPEVARRVSCQVHFGAKRTIYETQSLEYLKQVFFGWNIFCPLLAKFYGYVPAVKYKFG